MKHKSYKFQNADLGVFKTKICSDIVKDINKGCRIIGITNGDFSLIDLIYSILCKVGKSDVYCVTWSAGIKDVFNVDWIKSINLLNKFILITDRSYKTRQKRYAMSIEELFGMDNIWTTNIHAKFTLIENKDYKITIRTSMNLNANRTCENFEIDEDEKIYRFYKEFVDFIRDNQDPGFIESKSRVNKTLDLFYEMKAKMTKWSEI